MLGILSEPVKWKVVLMEFSLLLAIAGYLVAGYVYGQWYISLLVFLIPMGVSILISDDSFLVITHENKDVWLVVAAMSIIYIGLGLLWPSTWGWLWMIFLLIPMYAINKHAPSEHKLVAFMPFISVILFFSLGFFLGWWAFSWIAFLLIPMVAIIKNA
jgi:hypothetical protein